MRLNAEIPEAHAKWQSPPCGVWRAGGGGRAGGAAGPVNGAGEHRGAASQHSRDYFSSSIGEESQPVSRQSTRLPSRNRLHL